jgi:co-chaperonin GroES (HSP10)
MEGTSQGVPFMFHVEQVWGRKVNEQESAAITEQEIVEQEVSQDDSSFEARMQRKTRDEILAALNETLYDMIPMWGQWVIVKKKFREETKTEGGVVIKGQERSSLGEIVWSGDLEDKLKPGDTVVFSNFAMECKDTEELTGMRDLFLVRKEEIYAKLRARPKG